MLLSRRPSVACRRLSLRRARKLAHSGGTWKLDPSEDGISARLLVLTFATSWMTFVARADAALSRARGPTWEALWPSPSSKSSRKHHVGQALEPEAERLVPAAAAANLSKPIYQFIMTLTSTGMRSDEAHVEVVTGRFRERRDRRQEGEDRVRKQRAISIHGDFRGAMEHHVSGCAWAPVRANWYVFPGSQPHGPGRRDIPVTSLKTKW